MSLVAVARKLHGILAPHGVIIGGVCGMMHGVERFTRDVDMATDLDAEQVIQLLKQEGVSAEIRRGDAVDRLSWVVSGLCDDVEFQILAAKDIGIDLAQSIVKVELSIASKENFITSKCIAAGQQDLHDVAVLVLQNPNLQAFAAAQAEQYGCMDKLQSWLDDKRLKERYLSK